LVLKSSPNSYPVAKPLPVKPIPEPPKESNPNPTPKPLPVQPVPEAKPSTRRIAKPLPVKPIPEAPNPNPIVKPRPQPSNKIAELQARLKFNPSMLAPGAKIPTKHVEDEKDDTPHVPGKPEHEEAEESAGKLVHPTKYRPAPRPGRRKPTRKLRQEIDQAKEKENEMRGTLMLMEVEQMRRQSEEEIQLKPPLARLTRLAEMADLSQSIALFTAIDVETDAKDDDAPADEHGRDKEPEPHPSQPSAPKRESQEESKGWVCASCTFINAAETERCEMCDNPHQPTSQTQQSPASQSQWACRLCTYLNEESHTMCAVCFTEKDKVMYDGKWKDQVATLEAMGFDRNKCLALLDEHDGKLELVIQALL